MNIHFSIEYKTNWGENIRVQVRSVNSMGNTVETEYCLHTYDGVVWDGEISIQFTDKLIYKYALYEDNKLIWTEWDLAPHVVYASRSINNYFVKDSWRPIPENAPMFSSAITDCAEPHHLDELKYETDKVLQLRVVEPRLKSGCFLGITGSSNEFGQWRKVVRMSMLAPQEWAVNINVDKLTHILEYKYVVVDKDNNVLQWEDGINRRLPRTDISKGCMLVKTDSSPRFTLPRWKCAGVVVPVFSLRSEESYGIGDFGDLKSMVGWAASVGMKVIQILPVNDTTRMHTWHESYPYNAISVYALHPIYCDINSLPELNDKLAMEKFKMKRQKLNSFNQIDYERAEKCKRDFLHLSYVQDGDVTMQTNEFKAFEKNNQWLQYYAAFCALREKFKTANFNSWGEYSVFTPQIIESLKADKDMFDVMQETKYIQFVLHNQLLAVRKEARRHGVIIKGDIPIGISSDSVEAWAEPRLFNLNSQAGAPPDAFSVNGQNWGFPTYNWEIMAADGYKWWKNRFEHMSQYFDAYRIDHVLGFFRIWDIPSHSVQGLLGQFSPSLPMSKEEIENYGFTFDESMTEPLITDESINKTFGGKDEYVKVFYLERNANNTYRLKEQFNTQRKIEHAFEGKNDEESRNMRDGLYYMAGDVLFIRDRINSSMFHPRISSQFGYMYSRLSKQQQQAYNILYDDYFYKRHNQFWYDEAMKKLPCLIQATKMLVCAEDLGMVPDCVPWVMDRLRILSLEIFSMPKDSSSEFGVIENYPYRSVATISTHDMPTLREWWEEDYARSRRFYNNVLKIDGTAPEVLPGWLAEEIVSRHLYSPSMMCIISLQDWLAIDDKLRYSDCRKERINVPANQHHYWRYRMHITIGQLKKQHKFNSLVHDLIVHSER